MSSLGIRFPEDGIPRLSAPPAAPREKPNLRYIANFVFSETALIRFGAALLARGLARSCCRRPISYFHNQTRSSINEVAGANAKPSSEESCTGWRVKPGRPAFPSLVLRRDGPDCPPPPSRSPPCRQRKNRIAYYANLCRLRNEFAGAKSIFRPSVGLRLHRACGAAREGELSASGGGWLPHLFRVWPDVTPEAPDPPS